MGHAFHLTENIAKNLILNMRKCLGTCRGSKSFPMTNSKGTFKDFGAQRPALSCISKNKVKHLQSKTNQEFKPKELISVTDL